MKTLKKNSFERGGEGGGDDEFFHSKQLARNLSVLCGQGRGTLPQEKAIDRPYHSPSVFIIIVT